jgi:hypothetical protein
MAHQISSAEAKSKGMPEIPDGWHYEMSTHNLDVMHVVWPEHGAASVNFKHRTVAAGWTVPQRGAEAAKPSGKGWRAALVSEAVSILKAAWN